jgi:hypothetical protein
MKYECLGAVQGTALSLTVTMEGKHLEDSPDCDSKTSTYSLNSPFSPEVDPLSPYRGTLELCLNAAAPSLTVLY